MSQVVLITEAQSPWNEALCRYFAHHQWKVIACLPGRASVERSGIAGIENICLVTLDTRSKESVQTAAGHVQEWTEHIDVIVSQAGFGDPGAAQGISEMSSAWMLDAFNANALGPIRVIEAFLPMMKTGMKRIALLTDPKGSLGLGLPGTDMAYGMSKAALHMAFTMMHGDLNREGFTFRLYAPAAIGETEASMKAAYSYFTQSREDEERIVLLDEFGAEVPL